MALTKVLIAVKTYPTISAKYDELVCTAGFTEDGEWIRIYPIPYRKKSYDEQYRKYDWVEVDLVKNRNDYRPESFRPYSSDSKIEIVDHIGTENNWARRKPIALKNVHYNLTDLINQAHDKTIRTSLAVFKPTAIKDFKIVRVSRTWDKKKLEKLQQMNLFQTAKDQKFEVVRKLPYKFSYVAVDNMGREATMMVEDWELGQLFWRQLAKHEGNEAKACADVKLKYFDNFAKTKDLYLFLGTTKSNHHVSNNPFMIIGTFYPKFEIKKPVSTQTSMFD